MQITKFDVITVLIAVIIMACSLCIIKPTIVSGKSMDDTLQDGNYLILNKLAYFNDAPSRGDIVVFPGDEGNKLFIKRIIGIGGDTIEIKGNTVFLNGTVLSEPYVRIDEDMYNKDRTWTIPDGYVFAMGDNRAHSHDSRDDSLGFVDESDIVGKVVVRLFPFSEIGAVE